jgi:hypothetical protein
VLVDEKHPEPDNEEEKVEKCLVYDDFA